MSIKKSIGEINLRLGMGSGERTDFDVTVEFANWDELYENPFPPYTKDLLSAVPIPNLRKAAPVILWRIMR
ncbi:MAG: hypothetical protein J0L96_03070 [Anaerolineae bacterium]|nr:hypothetical protein [Anaerolineae bacterium]